MMHWTLWCLTVLGLWCLLDIILVACWAGLVHRRERFLKANGLMVDASYYPSVAEEQAITRAKEVLSS